MPPNKDPIEVNAQNRKEIKHLVYKTMTKYIITTK